MKAEKFRLIGRSGSEVSLTSVGTLLTEHRLVRGLGCTVAPRSMPDSCTEGEEVQMLVYGPSMCAQHTPASSHKRCAYAAPAQTGICFRAALTGTLLALLLTDYY